MTMFWHDKKVALRIIDDPSGWDFNPADYPGYQVLEVTTAQIADRDQMKDIADELARLMGMAPVKRTPQWEEANKRAHAMLFG